MQAMLKEKKIQDIINNLKLEPITVRQIKKKNKDNTIAIKIIKQELNFNFYINVISK